MIPFQLPEEQLNLLLGYYYSKSNIVSFPESRLAHPNR
jgi:hypothetical protein